MEMNMELQMDIEKKEKNTVKEMIGEGVKFERIRRITGYLVGSIDRFNDAKRAEVADRIKHLKAPYVQVQ